MIFCMPTIGLGREFSRERGNEVTWKRSKVFSFRRMSKENNRITES